MRAPDGAVGTTADRTVTGDPTAPEPLPGRLPRCRPSEEAAEAGPLPPRHPRHPRRHDAGPLLPPSARASVPAGDIQYERNAR
ncbi:hypothetical protein ACIGO8_02995 [Streptomyces sp. NPDC053493]|uniref:hypothetical protein n=1 Tax=Streptomyces sp. NPDC053493 TaxID=3365705 RepID=UPI0037D1B319